MWTLLTLPTLLGVSMLVLVHGTLATPTDFLQFDGLIYHKLFKPICCHYYGKCLPTGINKWRPHFSGINKWRPCPSLPQDISAICQKIFSKDIVCPHEGVTSQRTAAYDRREGHGKDACVMVIQPGPCKMALTRYAYNQSSGRCESFLYGGCSGNKNNFYTLEECNRKCVADLSQVTAATSTDTEKQALKESRCSQPLWTGPCKMFTSRFGFDSRTGQCRSFLYGGCRGNENRFLTMQECQLTCGAPGSNTG